MSRSYKVVLLGEGRVGKTSILLRYVQNSFDENMKSTIQATHMTKRLNLPPPYGKLELNIWDTAGQERFHALGPIYYRESQGAILVYDVTDPPSFEKVKNWVKELRKMLGKDVVLAIAGNKIDMHRDIRVSDDVADEYAASVGAFHVKTSAKANLGIDELFLEIAKKIAMSTGNDMGSSTIGSGGTMRSNSFRQVDVLDETVNFDNDGKGGCC